MLQEFDVEIRDKRGAENLAADHLSRLENPFDKHDRSEIRDSFPDEQLMSMTASEPWYADFANYLASRLILEHMTRYEKKRFFAQLKYYFLDEPFLFRRCPDQIIRCCVSEGEALKIMRECHSGPSGGHHGISTTAGNISNKDEAPQNFIQVCEVFDVWGIDFMGPFPSSRGNEI